MENKGEDSTNVSVLGEEDFNGELSELEEYGDNEISEDEIIAEAKEIEIEPDSSFTEEVSKKRVLLDVDDDVSMKKLKSDIEKVKQEMWNKYREKNPVLLGNSMNIKPEYIPPAKPYNF
jgi:hypothetical protein